MLYWVKRIFARSTLWIFWESYPDSELYLRTWYDMALKSEWFSPEDVKQSYAHASILKNGRVVFNIKGNRYRLVAKINYEKQWVFIRFIGTHSDYDRIDADSI